MNAKCKCFIILLIFKSLIFSAQEKIGAVIPWASFEAEHMKTNGTVLGPKYIPFNVETESSGQRCVKLNSSNEYLEFISSIDVNSMVIRYSLPDSKDGNGATANLGIYKNGTLIKNALISSKYSHLYGIYPFSNNPDGEKQRNFYDEVRIKDIQISEGDTLSLKLDDNKKHEVKYVIIDLVDLEKIPPPLKAPANSLSITDEIFSKNTNEDYTAVFKKSIDKAVKTGKSIWIPSGNYKITGDIVIPSNVSIKGAGMWYSQLEGDAQIYSDPEKRVRLRGDGDNINLSDFAITGKLSYRNDSEANDGIVGSFGEKSTISRIWIEHTKVGIWIENSKGLIVEGCRLRNTIADGINFCVGMANSTIKNCTARGTGDDCFAIWPAVFMNQKYQPGQNLIENCTAQLPFLANGVSVYGGKGNQVKNCSFSDISPGSAILISTTFPTTDKNKGIDNNFSGITRIENCIVQTSGGFDHTWGWRAAVQICLDKQSISSIEIKDLKIDKSLSEGFNVIARNQKDEIHILSDAVFKNIIISNSVIATENKGKLWYPNEKYSSLIPIDKIELRTLLY